MTEEDLLAVGAQDLSREDAHWVSLPVGEFENLHESNRLLREKIAQLQELAAQWAAQAERSEAAARRWRTVVSATHANGYGHWNPYLECPSAICVAARMEKA